MTLELKQHNTHGKTFFHMTYIIYYSHKYHIENPIVQMYKHETDF
jgi:hypothetical protein